MNKRWRTILLISSTALCVMLFGWFVAGPAESTYQGRKLSEWLRECSNQAGNRSLDEKRANEAMRAIGTNALPQMIRLLKDQDNPWLVKSLEFLRGKIGARINLTLPSDTHSAVIEGFGILGQKAEPAIPDLVELWNSTNETINVFGWQALNAIGTRNLVPIFVAALTNADRRIRIQAISSLTQSDEVSPAAIPLMVSNLTQAYASEKRSIARALGQIGCCPAESIPALKQLLEDQEPLIRSDAAWALGHFGAAARKAIPELATRLNDTDEHVRFNARRALLRVECEFRDGGIIRGPKPERKIAMVFTAHEYAEGSETILNALSNHSARASFFLTGTFMIQRENGELLDRIAKSGHFIGPHSFQHLLYCSWDKTPLTLISFKDYEWDVSCNEWKCSPYLDTVNRRAKYFLPAYEHYNREISMWTRTFYGDLICFTPGTRSNADYTGEADTNFVPSQAIFDSILKREREDPHGLNGFILLLHLGSGPGRQDKFHTRFGELLDVLAAKGYQFVRVDELLEPPAEKETTKPESPQP